MISFYDLTANFYDILTWGMEKRYRETKQSAFSSASGRVLLVGVGTGIDLSLLPAQLEVTAIDISEQMLAKAAIRSQDYQGQVRLRVADIENTDFPNNYFDTVITSCVFCSVKNPVKGLQEIKRILRSESQLIMFEHVLSQNPFLKPMLYFMNLLMPFGPDFTRDTVANVKKAGFKILSERNVYMDIIKEINAR